MPMFIQSVNLKYCSVLGRIMPLCYIPHTKNKRTPSEQSLVVKAIRQNFGWICCSYSSNIQDKIKHQYYIISTTFSNISFKHDKSCIPLLYLFITISKVPVLLIQKQRNGIKGNNLLFFKVAFVETEFRQQNYQNHYVSLHLFMRLA